MRETLLLLIFAGQSAAKQGKCAACVGRMDQTGAILGNPACFEDLEEVCRIFGKIK
jgi:Fe-S-cluster-containing dehydrogenase component